MRKILFLYHVSTIGGGSYCLLSILKSLDRGKFLPMVLLQKEGPLCDEIRKLNIRIFFLPSIRTVPYNSSLFHFRNIKNLISLARSISDYKSLLSDIRPDAIYVNTMMMYPYLSPAKKMGIKTYIHIREHWPEQEHKIQREIAVNSIIHNAFHIIAINRYSASIFRNVSERVTIVYDWIDMDIRFCYLPIETVMNENCNNLKIYLYTGGLQSIKGILEIVRTFHKSIKGENKRLLILGIPETNRSAKGIIGIIKNIFSIFGYKTYSQKVFDIIKEDTRIVCKPSVYDISHIMQQVYAMVSYFTIPHANLALAEGIIVGTPTIAALTDESLEYSNEGELALLFKLNNIDDFTSKWLSFDTKYDTLKRKISEDSSKIKEKFDSQRNIQILNNVLTSNFE